MFLVTDYNFVQPVTVLSETDTHATLECMLTGLRFEHDKSASHAKLFANKQDAHDWNAKQPF
jgi:hypothetical protein